ncbi:sodium/proton antiporter, CPA1 family [Microbulbifer donghaiensis]|uniref:Sodium/proton antiporter, CPA1 family n=1 Tax=Microbulbifer donghaiensis TaxID=494016 RepID=A0A1M5AKB6_9GAMM|nr:Na+/H+ antiporter [Microbulbifer donghaiensis]SHF30663.1 sodium/proton antiporter, CPA1 family [Microbulbifer donghaiensis]
MHYVAVALLLLVAVTFSGIIARVLPRRLPLPLIQIATGVLLGSVFGVKIPLDPEIFFLLFIPPLLFLDGWRIPKGAFFRDLRPILTLAVGLVLFTVVGMAPFIHWLVPAMPLAVCFAVAAILAPTDPVALAAVRGSTPLPPRLRHVLQGEALLNDASGLDVFRFAVVAVVSGSFSLAQTAAGFVWMVAAGVAIGVGVALACAYALRGLGRLGGEDTGIEILVSLLVPFAAYLASEHLGGSGILAAATGGIATQYVNLRGPELSATRMERQAVWNTVQDVLNGVIFVLLGEQLVRILNAYLGPARLSAAASDWTVLLYVIAITAALLILRFVWVWVSLYLTRIRREIPDTRERLLLVTVTALAGVRGAVTLAGVLSLPLLLPDGSGFPARELAVVIAMGVILTSLLLASFTLPPLVRRLPARPQMAEIGDERGARVAAARAALSRLQALRDGIEEKDEAAEVEREALDYLLDLYRRRLARGDSNRQQRVWMLARSEREFHLDALAAERDQLFRLRIERQIDDELHRKLVLEVDLIEASLRSED